MPPTKLEQGQQDHRPQSFSVVFFFFVSQITPGELEDHIGAKN